MKWRRKSFLKKCKNDNIIFSLREISLSANRNSEFDGWSGMYNSNPLSVKIITEHIHNDIYLWKLREIYGKEMYENVYIETEFERKSRRKSI